MLVDRTVVILARGVFSLCVPSFNNLKVEKHVNPALPFPQWNSTLAHRLCICAETLAIDDGTVY